MAEPNKRQRLELDVADADSWKNRSLFMETLGRGSGDTLPLIFKHLSSLKDKIQLESVCKLFQKHGKSVEAWSNIKCINISVADDDEEDDDDFYLINDDFVPDCFISHSFWSIFSRCRKLRELHLSCRRKRMSNVAYHWIVEAILMQGGASTLNNLQELHLNASLTPESSQEVVRLIDVFKDQLTALELTNMRFYNLSNIMTRPWKQIGECANLTSFFIDGSSAVSCIEMTKRALCGKMIQKLGLGDCCTGAGDLVEIVSSLADQSLRMVAIKDRFFSLSDFVDKLPAAQWNSIKEIHYMHKDQMWDTRQSLNWSTILRLPRINPQLQILVLHARCKQNQAVELVLSYLKILNESMSNRSFSIGHKLSLRGDGWKKVFDMLAKKHKCEVVRVREDLYRIRCLHLGRSCVHLFEH